MSAAERTAQILKVVDDNRIPIVETPKEMTWAAERATQLLAAADTKAERMAHTFTEMCNAHQETHKKKRGSPKGSSKTCGLCGETGHNKRTCTMDLNALD